MNRARSRREILLTLGTAVTVSFAGCGRGRLNESGEASTRSATASATPSSNSISVDDIAFEVSVAKQSTGQHPAQVIVRIENWSDASILFQPASIFAPRWRNVMGSQANGGPELLLAESVPEWSPSVSPETPTECWQAPSPLPTPSPFIPQSERITPESSSTTAFWVYVVEGNECLSPGEYEFTSELEVWPPDEYSENLLELDLRFTLAVDEAHQLTIGSFETSSAS